MSSEELDALLAALGDLEREHAAGDLDDADYASLRDDYVARAAALSRGQTRAGGGTKRPRGWPRRVLGVGAVVAVGAAAGVWVAASSGQRLPGGSITGGIEESTAGRLATARQLNFSDPPEAIRIYTEVLRTDPDNVEALTYRAWLVALTAREASAPIREAAHAAVLADLARARRIDPGYPDAPCFLGIIRFRFLGDAAGADPVLKECLASGPPSEVRGFVEAILADVAAALED